MKVPRQLQPLIHDGLIDEVIRPLMAGKEASVYIVVAQGEICCAKAYKDATQRSFRQRANYQEGRRVRNSRRARAMQRGTRFGKRELEEDWQNAEVDALYRLAGAGVRVPKPLNFATGVLLMELIVDGNGDVAPRLNDVTLSAETAQVYFQSLLRDVVKTLCVGLIHGDLSEYNVLVAATGPVIIDLPQVVDAAANNNAERMLRRDVGNLAAYFGRSAPELLTPDYGREIWQLWEAGTLRPDTELTGKYKQPTKEADVGSVLRDIEDAREDAQRRRPGRPRKEKKGDEAWRGRVPDAEPGQPADKAAVASIVSPTGNRKIVDLRRPTPKPEAAVNPAPKKKRRRRRRSSGGDGGGSDNRPKAAQQAPAVQGQGPRAANEQQKPQPTSAPGQQRRRRRRRRGGGGGGGPKKPAE